MTGSDAFLMKNGDVPGHDIEGRKSKKNTCAFNALTLESGENYRSGSLIVWAWPER